MSEESAAIHGVVGVVIWTDELERMVRFYRDTLGLPLHSLHEGFAAFRWGRMRLSIGLHSAVHGPARDPYRMMVNLGTRDIHGLYERLRERGVEFIRPPQREVWGGWVATFKDPDGNILQLLQQPPERQDQG